MRTHKIEKTIIITSLFLTIIWILSAIYTFVYGLEPWGIHKKVVWGTDIVNFVFWIGNSHSGTLISAILYLLRQQWREPIHRIAETMTIISIIIAGFFPLIHLGRPWFFYWLFPLPNQISLWVNFKSPLIWDLIAIFTYMILSFLFWFLGILPDHKLFNIKNPKRKRKVLSFLNKYWSGSSANWKEYHWTYNLFAGILTFVVVSVHSIVSFDFSVTILPVWHSTMLPIYFVVGAIYSGLALLLFVTAILTKYNLSKTEIPKISGINLSKLILTFSLLTLYFYLLEYFFGFYLQEPSILRLLSLRFNSSYFILTLIMIFQIFILPQFFWFEKVRKNTNLQILISFNVVIGMWLERFLLIVPTLSFDLITNEKISYNPTIIDYSLTFGSLGFFVLSFYLIGKIIPMVPKSKI
jgi:molybdopterin-containing oxidoreductase family membrane subunit